VRSSKTHNPLRPVTGTVLLKVYTNIDAYLQYVALGRVPELIITNMSVNLLTKKNGRARNALDVEMI
jgi:hypothetical protein